MLRLALYSVSSALILGSVAAHAQLPSDNPVWKTRCSVLASAAADIDRGSTPAVLVAATRGVAGAKFLSLAAESSENGNHSVACALFYLAAVADRAGNSGKPDVSAAASALTLAASEVHAAHGQSLSFSEHMAWAGLKVSLMRSGGLNASESQSVLTAATTMPLSLTATPAVQTAGLVRGHNR